MMDTMTSRIRDVCHTWRDSTVFETMAREANIRNLWPYPSVYGKVENWEWGFLYNILGVQYKGDRLYLTRINPAEHDKALNMAGVPLVASIFEPAKKQRKSEGSDNLDTFHLIFSGGANETVVKVTTPPGYFSDLSLRVTFHRLLLAMDEAGGLSGLRGSELHQSDKAVLELESAENIKRLADFITSPEAHAFRLPNKEMEAFGFTLIKKSQMTLDKNNKPRMLQAN